MGDRGTHARLGLRASFRMARGQQQLEETCTLDHADIWVINWEVDFNIGQTDQTVENSTTFT
ncbi:MAG: hypothetical protein U0229_26490 [Anaeromyxobacter sp.]